MLKTKKNKENRAPLETVNKKKKLFMKKPAMGGTPARASRQTIRENLKKKGEPEPPRSGMLTDPDPPDEKRTTKMVIRQAQ